MPKCKTHVQVIVLLIKTYCSVMFLLMLPSYLLKLSVTWERVTLSISAFERCPFANNFRIDDPTVMESRQYYRIAHSFQEDITEQPSILVGGQLKEYQVSMTHCITTEIKATKLDV